MKKFIALTITIVFLIAGCGDKKHQVKQPADLALLGAKVITMDDSQPEAEAIAVKDGKILAVGSQKEIRAFITQSTRILDLKGKTVIPGLIESHGHFTGLGYSKIRLDLTKVQNWEEVIQMVENAVKRLRPGTWILGRGWHQEKWNHAPEPNIDGLPIHNALSKISPDNPVFFQHASGHSAFANAKAMDLAGVDERTPNPEGGEIVKGANGMPIGIFRETALDLISDALKEYQDQMSQEEKDRELEKAIMLADKSCLENGITSFHDAGVTFKQIDLYKQLVTEKKLNVRLNVMIGEDNEALKEKISQYRIIDFGDSHLTVRAIKRLIDGALGSHGAWLLEPYASMPNSTGLNTEPIAAMKETAEIAINNGFQLCTHAIGDRGNRETLNIYQEAFKNHPDKTNLRWRIEHAQHLHPDDIGRFGKLGVIAACQSVHCTSDGPWVLKRLGEKRAEEGAYVWRKLMDSGAVICNGTDVPVEDVNPIECYYSAVTRKMKKGDVFYGDQKMTRREALQTYTLNGAYASFEENIKGSLSVGKLADITVLSQDLLTVPDDDLLNTKVIYTIVGGKIVYEGK